MAFAKCSIVFLMAMAMIGVCIGAVYKVGDSHGWTNEGHFSYRRWSHSKNFTAGDTLVFEYNGKKQNVVQVSQKHFKECKAKDPLFTSESGDDHIKLTPGNFFYICSLPGHCEAGQKVHIRAYASSKGPSPSASTPSPSPSASTPSPSPSTAAPSPSPSTVTPSPSPSASTPSPTPSASTPSPSPSASTKSPSPSPWSHAPTPSGPSPSPAPSHNPSSSPSHSPNKSPNPSPIPRPNPPSVPTVPRAQTPSPPQRARISHKSQAAPTHSSSGIPIMQVLMAVAVLAYIF